MFVSVWIIALPLLGEAPVILPTGAIAIVHANVVEGVKLESKILVVPPEQIVWEDGVAVATGFGFTMTTTFIGSPSQPFAIGVMV
jgi:hypothetical protein